MAWFNSKVRVTFIDETTGESLGVAELPPGDLPETFEIDATLHLGGDDWSVVDADPKTRSEYAKTKSLKLRLHRIEKIAPHKILFSLPSICDSIPGLGDQPLVGNEFVLGEDDWRQLELVCNDLASEVDAEIAKIRAIHENASAGVGWHEIHVRTKPVSPLKGHLRLGDLAKMIPGANPVVGVVYRGAGTPILDGYALRAGGFTIYGVAPGGIVSVIAFDPYAGTSQHEILNAIKSLARNLGLDLVDWCRCARLPFDDSHFDALFQTTWK